MDHHLPTAEVEHYPAMLRPWIGGGAGSLLHQERRGGIGHAVLVRHLRLGGEGRRDEQEQGEPFHPADCNRMSAHC